MELLSYFEQKSSLEADKVLLVLKRPIAYMNFSITVNYFLLYFPLIDTFLKGMTNRESS
jgi:hypothetical protein